MTLSQVISTSLRMCVESRIVCCWPSSRIKLRVERICVGSRPAVGSSRISTGGIGEQGVGQADALAIALGQRADELAIDVGEPAAFEDVVDALVGVRRRRCP